MSFLKLAGIVLIVAGIFGLVYGNFSYPNESHEGKIGNISISVKENKNVNVPIWAGVSLVVVGAVLFFAGNKK